MFIIFENLLWQEEQGPTNYGLPTLCFSEKFVSVSSLAVLMLPGRAERWGQRYRACKLLNIDYLVPTKESGDPNAENCPAPSISINQKYLCHQYPESPSQG